MIKRMAPWALAVLLCVVAAAAYAAPEVGTVPPDYLGKTPGGEEVRISERRGKVVLVSFWASWCGYCRKQFPMLDTFQRSVDRDRLEVIVVNYKEPVRDFRRAVRQARSSPVTWTHDYDGSISEAFGVNAVPRLFVIDKYGELALTRAGYSEERLPALIDAINELLAEKGPQDPSPTALQEDSGAP
ncbi:TlpA family protein disulfide reductase [Luteimonas sp. A478]